MIFDKIKTICKEQNRTIRSLEKECGLSKGSIAKWNESDPTARKLFAVAVALGVTVEFLLN